MERPLNVLVSATALRGAGSAALGRGVLAALGASGIEYSAWVPAEWGTGHPVGSGFARKVWHENLSIRKAARRHDVLFSLGDTGTPFARVPHLLLVQQAYLAYEPCDWGFVPSARLSARMRAIAAYFSLARGSITRFTVQTNDMRQRLHERWDIPLERIGVTPSSVLPLPDVAPARSQQPYVACITSAGEHKNLTILADILATLRSDLQLWVTVLPRDVPALVRRARQLRVSERIVWLGAVPRAAALGVLATATAAVLPATLESFGFGFYEAMAMGCPIVAADRGFAREACGDAASYAPPDAAERFAQHLDSLTGNRAHGARGRARFERIALTWEAVGERYVDELRRTVEEFHS